MMSEAEKKATWITENIITAMPNGKGKKRERPKGCAGEKRHEQEDRLKESAARLIDARIEELDDWRGEMLSRLRA